MKISFVGVLIVVAGISLMAACDIIFDLGYGYEIKDLLIALVIFLSSFAIYALISRVVSVAEDK